MEDSYWRLLDKLQDKSKGNHDKASNYTLIRESTISLLGNPCQAKYRSGAHVGEDEFVRGLVDFVETLQLEQHLLGELPVEDAGVVVGKLDQLLVDMLRQLLDQHSAVLHLQNALFEGLFDSPQQVLLYHEKCLPFFRHALGRQKAEPYQLFQHFIDGFLQTRLGDSCVVEELGSVPASSDHLCVEDVGLDVRVVLKNVVAVGPHQTLQLGRLLNAFEAAQPDLGLQLLDALRLGSEFSAVAAVDEGGCEVVRKLLLRGYLFDS